MACSGNVRRCAYVHYGLVLDISHGFSSPIFSDFLHFPYFGGSVLNMDITGLTVEAN